MEYMIDLIRSEFELAQYKQLDKEGLLWKHKDYNDFWQICVVEGDFDIDVLQEQIFADLTPLRKDIPESEKSTSLLILQLVHDVKGKEPQQVIDVENNVYYFKKYVIQFTREDWEATRQVIPADFQNLGQVLMRPDVFEHIKHDENNPYRLLYTIAHKLPFVMMQAERRDYNPIPALVFDVDLQPIFAWTEEMMDMTGRNVSDEELIAAKAAINSFINAEENE